MAIKIDFLKIQLKAMIIYLFSVCYESLPF